MSGSGKRTTDPWARLRHLTPARIALGRAGAALPTAEVLKLSLAHARARDAVHAALDVDRLAIAIEGLGMTTLRVESAAADRATYLTRPDLGRQLSESSRIRLLDWHPAGPRDRAAVDLAIVVADGLSARAVEAQTVALLAALSPYLAAAGWSTAPVVIATQARVALADEIATHLGAKAVVMLIGERPGLSSPDSLGAYLTLAPRPGRTDAERNCISNIRPAGLSFELAAYKIAWLLAEAFKRGATGVQLKDESDALLIDGRPPPPRLAAPA
jgi:ethanolamine ammonia-lyase small subunit